MSLSTQMMKHVRASLLAVSVVAVLAGLMLQTEPLRSQDVKGGVVAVAVPEEAAFKHQEHAARAKEDGKAWDCKSCHTDGTGKAMESRPGQSDHKSCDSAGCHADDFYDSKKAKETKICMTCHVEANYWADMSRLRRYPDKCYDDREYYTEFSHKKHLDASVTLEGKAVACSSCHQGNGGAIRGLSKGVKQDDCHIQGDLSNPGHDNCVQCHGVEVKPTPETKMTDCVKCHRDRLEKVQKADQREWVGKVRHSFSHGFHQDAANQAYVKKKPVSLECGTCHVGIRKAETVQAAMMLAGMRKGKGPSHAICGTCHGKAKVERGNRMRGVFTTRDSGTSCSKCHTRAFVQSNFRVNLGGVFGTP